MSFNYLNKDYLRNLGSLEEYFFECSALRDLYYERNLNVKFKNILCFEFLQLVEQDLKQDFEESQKAISVPVEAFVQSFFGKDKKVRVNTISQSPTPTTAGQGVILADGKDLLADVKTELGF